MLYEVITTVTAQILAFKVTQFALPMITVGVKVAVFVGVCVGVCVGVAVSTINVTVTVVITSYSIHYTKLYEPAVYDFSAAPLFVNPPGADGVLGGSEKELYHSIADKLFPLEGDFDVYCGLV